MQRLTNSIIKTWNAGLCERARAVGSKGTRVGAVPNVDHDRGDLHLTDASTVAIADAPAPRARGTEAWLQELHRLDVDGEPFAPGTAGADQPETSRCG